MSHKNLTEIPKCYVFAINVKILKVLLFGLTTHCDKKKHDHITASWSLLYTTSSSFFKELSWSKTSLMRHTGPWHEAI